VGGLKKNATAVNETVRFLRQQKRITDADEALVTLCRRLAVACDAAPGNAALWREYRGAVASLMEVGADVGDDDEAASFAESVRTPVRDAEEF